MSRIGKKPIEVPAGVSIQIEGQEGPLTLSVAVTIADGGLLLR